MPSSVLEWVLGGVLGLVVGSALTVLAEHGSVREWAARARSQCPRCGVRLRGTELIPLVSFLVLRGRCRSCGARIPPWHVWTEAAALALFLFAIPLTGGAPPWERAVVVLLLGVLLALAVIDLRQFLLPDALVALVALLGLARSLLTGAPGLAASLLGGLLGIGLLGILAVVPWPRRRSATRLRPAVAPTSPRLRRAGKASAGRHGFGGAAMGLGDVKLAGAMGLTLGALGLVAALALAFVAGGLMGLVLLATRRARLQSRIAFGPFLCGGTALVLLVPGLPARFLGLLGVA